MHNISNERIGTELVRMLVHSSGADAVQDLQEFGMLKHFLPEVSAMIGLEQNEHHQEGDAWMHTLIVLDSLHENPSPTLVVAALLHDTGKVQTQQPREDGKGYTFHGHEDVSADIAATVYDRLSLGMAKVDKDLLVWLVQNHMRVREVGTMRPGKRLALFRHPGFPQLMALLKADDHGKLPFVDSYTEVGALYQDYLDNYKDATPKARGIDGHRLMRELNLKPSRYVGELLDYTDECLAENPSLTGDELVELARSKVLVDAR